MQVNWLLSNIKKDKEEEIKFIETVLDVLKMYINPTMFKKEQELKKQDHTTTFDKEITEELKGKGLTDDQLRMLQQALAE